METSTTQLTLSELSTISDCPGRTIRYYISRELLPGPHQRGRDAYYSQEHVVRLKQIETLSQQGLTLSEIGVQFNPPQTPEPELWKHIVLGDGITLLVRGDVSQEVLRNTLNMFKP